MARPRHARFEPRHVLVSLADTERLTGLSPAELLAERDVQTLIRVGAKGAREEMLRIPVALLLSEQADSDAA